MVRLDRRTAVPEGSRSMRTYFAHAIMLRLAALAVHAVVRGATQWRPKGVRMRTVPISPKHQAIAELREAGADGAVLGAAKKNGCLRERVTRQRQDILLSRP